LYDKRNQQVSSYYDIQGKGYTTLPSTSYYYTVSVTYARQSSGKIGINFTITPNAKIQSAYGIQSYTSPYAMYSVPIHPVLLSNSGLCSFLGGTSGIATCASIPLTTLTATLGGSCSYPNSLGKDSAGVLYECIGNQWTLPANSTVTPGTSCGPQGALGQASTAAYGWGTYVCNNGTWISTNSVLEATLVTQSESIKAVSHSIVGQSNSSAYYMGTWTSQTASIAANSNTNFLQTSSISAYENSLAISSQSMSLQFSSIWANIGILIPYFYSNDALGYNPINCYNAGGQPLNNASFVRFCVFNGSSCAAGFTPYYNYTTTSSVTCAGLNRCTTGSHSTLSNIPQEACIYYTVGDQRTCWANITSIACTKL
jgi:hypothetical protein